MKHENDITPDQDQRLIPRAELKIQVKPPWLAAGSGIALAAIKIHAQSYH
jgi:hypothetical protein